MLSSLAPQLVQAYAGTDYHVVHAEGDFVLRVGGRSARLDRLLAEQGVTSWAFLTAWNPGSIPIPPEQNQARQRQLEAEVIARGWAALAGHGRGQGDWPPEPSLLILGISEAEAVALARLFHQLALVVGVRGEPVRLLAIEPISAPC